MTAPTKREILRRKASSTGEERILPRPTFRATCQRHGLSGSELARLSGVSLRVVYNMYSPSDNPATQTGTTAITAQKLARALARKSGDLTAKEAWPLLWQYEDNETIRDIADSLRAYGETLEAMSMPHVAGALDQIAQALVSGDLTAITPDESMVARLQQQAHEADQIVASEASTPDKARQLRAIGLTFEEIGMRLGFSRAYAHELVVTP